MPRSTSLRRCRESHDLHAPRPTPTPRNVPASPDSETTLPLRTRRAIALFQSAFPGSQVLSLKALDATPEIATPESQVELFELAEYVTRR